MIHRKKIKEGIYNWLTLWKAHLKKKIRVFYSDQHQLTSTTAVDRYPELFTEAQRIFEGKQNTNRPSILSFGCSTGEECFSLRNYFKEALIIGVDINNRNLQKANRKNVDSNIKFLFSSTENIEKEGKYNLIFCLSVLCRWEDTKYLTNCEKIYPFQKFEDSIKELSSQLLDGGLLIIYNSNFRFEDTNVFNDFEIVNTPTVKDSGFVNKFDTNNNLLTDVHTTCIYRKMK
ncbi:MAG: class I SAM-dependent methyltransferase [Cyclobacteriaceae bacterium]